MPPLTESVHAAAVDHQAPTALQRAVAVVREERTAFWTFVALEGIALLMYLAVGRRVWFWFDEWNFLAGRSLTIADVLRPHNDHLVALPVIVYRALFRVFGLRTYLPYQLVTISIHLTVAALVRALMRRVGVQAWLATAAAALFLFFGSGSLDIIWAFQMTLSGSLMFGLVQLLLADHDGRIDRRDWFGLAAGLAAVACSGAGLAMLAAVGAATLIRRGWRAAAFHVAPIAAIVLLWRAGYVDGQRLYWYPELIPRWVWDGLFSGFRALGQSSVVAWLLVLMLMVGAIVFWASLTPADRRRRLSIPAGMLFGVLTFNVLTALSRSTNPFGAGSIRYLELLAALLIVPLAVAADALWRRWTVLIPVVAVIFLIGIPGNIGQVRVPLARASTYAETRRMMATLPTLPSARSVPRDLRPDPHLAHDVTIGWLLEARRKGWLPAPRRSIGAERSTDELRLSLQQLERIVDASKCPRLTESRVLDLQSGQRLLVSGNVVVRRTPRGRGTSNLVLFGDSLGTGPWDHELRVLHGPLRITISPWSPDARVCFP